MLKPVDFEVGKHYKDMDIEKVKPDTTIFKKDEYGDYYISRDLGERWKLINDVIESFEDTFTPFVDSMDDYGKVHNEIQRLADTGAVIRIYNKGYMNEELVYFKRDGEYIAIMSENNFRDKMINISKYNNVDIEFCLALAEDEAEVKFYKGGFREIKEDV